MSHTKAFTTGAAIAVVAGMLLLPGGTLARGGGGFAAGGHGPVFGFHPRVGHRPFRIVRRHHPLFAWHPWNRHRFAARYGLGASAIYPAADADYGATGNDLTGTVVVPGPGAFGPPGAPPSERAGCFSRGYEVPGESGGIARVTVTRC
jgi:hypothetical protein